MRTKRFRAALLSILIIAPLTVFLLVATTETAQAAIVEDFVPTDDADVAEGFPDNVVADGGNKYNMYNGWVEAVYLSERIYLKFDLSKVQAGTVDSTILRLNSKYGPSEGEPDYLATWHLIDAFAVENDNWLESEITWNNSPALVGSALDTENYQADDFLIGDPRCEDPNLGQLAWYEWDITSYVQSEVAGDKIVSICLKGQNEGSKNSAGWLYSKDSGDANSQRWPALRVTYRGVGLDISPSEKRGSPGEDVTFIVTVTNETGSGDTFTLSIDSEWPASLSTNVVGPLSDGSSEIVALAVTTPEGVIGSENEITITVTSQTDPNLYNSKTCTAGSTPIYPTDDAYVNNKQASVDTGDEEEVYVGTIIEQNIWENRRGYFKFDLSDIPSESTIDEAYLSVYTHYGGENGLPYGDATFTADAKKVDDDDWDESTLTWNNAPSVGDTLDSVVVPSTNDVRYRFNVSSYAQEQFEGDKVMSIGLVSAQEGQNKFTPFSSKETTYSGQKPYLIVYYTPVTVENRHDVDVSISPSSQSGDKGDTLSYTVTVKNTGRGYTDTYTLEATDNAGWTPSLSEDSVGPLSENASEDVTLSVTIPAGAENGDQDTVTVTATCQADPSVSDSASCIAKCVENIVPGEVEVAIDPTTKSGAPGEQLTYTVTVTNKGDATDTFSVEAMDTAEWSPTLSTPTTFSLDAGESRNLTLRITIPVNAAEGDSMTITVTASGTGYDDSITSTASVTKEEGLPMTLIAIVVVVVVVVVVVALMLLRGRKAAPSW